MERNQILKMLVEDDQKIISSLLEQCPANEKQVYGDVLNLIETWIHNLLYFKNIYPKEAFESRNIFGIQVFISKSTLLKQYIHQFIEDISHHIRHISFIQVIFIGADLTPIQISKLNLVIFDQISKEFIGNDQLFDSNIGRINNIQKQIQYKKFLNEMKTVFIRNFQRKQGEQITFKLEIGYRMEETSDLKKQKIKLIQDWTKIETIRSKKRQIVNSMKSDHINFIYEVIQIEKN